VEYHPYLRLFDMKTVAILFSFLIVPLTLWAQQKDYSAKARELVSKMTLEEKASLCSGLNFWQTKPIERLNIPSIFVTDGPSGLRKAKSGVLGDNIPATCFPTGSAMAATWDTDLEYIVGAAMGLECQANDVQILLAPGVNMKRSPLNGRNFEYFSEDPYLAGKMGAAFIEGVQSQGVGTSLKHFAANNQEFERMIVSSDMDQRTLHEMYLPAFEMIVKEAHPWTVMCAYNKINGVYCSEDPYLLDTVLRKDWGFQGLVVSDWGAVDDRVEGLKAGLDLEMPGNGGINDKKIMEAVKNGSLDPKVLDESVVNTLAIILKAHDDHKADASYSKEKHNTLAREAAAEAMVLLKNDGNVLPLSNKSAKKVSIIGDLAKDPHFEGGGSSEVNPTEVVVPYNELVKSLGKSVQVSYADGYIHGDSTSSGLIQQAQEAARKADVAVVFAGTPKGSESEGFDRTTIDLPDGQNQLIEAVAKVQPNIIVVLMNGSAVAMPWKDDVKGIVEAWLGGQAVGGAIADVLTGKVNPSGKLSETFPMRLEDVSSYLTFPGRDGHALYGERIFTGYRYFDDKGITPLFPFGYGLSYTTFAYSNMKLSSNSIKDHDSLAVQVTVKNTGKRMGKEVVQLYVHDQVAAVKRPEKELKGFAKAALEPGESKNIHFKLGFRDFAYYDTEISDWKVDTGKFDIMVGGSSDKLLLQETVEVTSTNTKYPKLTRNSLLKDFRDNPRGKAIYDRIINQMVAGMMGGNSNAANDAAARKRVVDMLSGFVNEMPINRLVTMSNGQFTEQMLDQMLQAVNQ